VFSALGGHLGPSLGDEVVPVPADVDDGVDPGAEGADLHPAVPGHEQRRGVVGEDEVERLVRGPLDLALDEPGRGLGAPVAQGVPDEEAPGALARVALGPAVGDADEEAGLVVPHPGAAGALVARRHVPGGPVADRRPARRPVVGLVTVGGDRDRRVLEDLPGEDEGAHARWYGTPGHKPA
jgi:hypothetical protein